MVYTEIRNINGKEYYYRVTSIRKGKRVSKKRIYLGHNLSDVEILKREKEADKKLLPKRMKIRDKEINKIKSKIVGILKKYSVKRAGLFGSYVRGEQKKNSDIDILVDITDKDMSLLGIAGLKLKLEEILGRKVDLVEYNAIKSLIRNRILNEEIRII